MRSALVSLAALGLLAAVGCAPSGLDVDEAKNVAEADGLRVQVQLPGRYFKTGQKIRVAVTATNTTGKPIEIHSPTGAPVLVRITRQTLLSPEQVRVYPGSATANILSWTLPAGQSRTFVLRVPVEPDWPVEELLHLSAELNGYGHLAPAVTVFIQSPRK